MDGLMVLQMMRRQTGGGAFLPCFLLLAWVLSLLASRSPSSSAAALQIPKSLNSVSPGLVEVSHYYESLIPRAQSGPQPQQRRRTTKTKTMKQKPFQQLRQQTRNRHLSLESEPRAVQQAGTTFHSHQQQQQQLGHHVFVDTSVTALQTLADLEHRLAALELAFHSQQPPPPPPPPQQPPEAPTSPQEPPETSPGAPIVPPQPPAGGTGAAEPPPSFPPDSLPQTSAPSAEPPQQPLPPPPPPPPPPVSTTEAVVTPAQPPVQPSAPPTSPAAADHTLAIPDSPSPNLHPSSQPAEQTQPETSAAENSPPAEEDSFTKSEFTLTFWAFMLMSIGSCFVGVIATYIGCKICYDR